MNKTFYCLARVAGREETASSGHLLHEMSRGAAEKLPIFVKWRS